MIEYESGVSREGKPFVQIHWGKEQGQLTPDETRTLGLQLIECAEAAEMDATVFDWLGVVVGTAPADLNKRATILAEFRKHREQARAKGEAP